MHHAPVQRRVDQARRRAPEERAVASSTSSPTLLACAPAVRWKVAPSASGAWLSANDRVGDVVDRHDVDRRVAARGQRHVGAARERAQRPVEHVERRRPAAVALADDDARAQHRDRQPRARSGRRQALGLELRLLVGVAKALADVEVVLAEAAPRARRRRTRSRCRRSAAGRRVHGSARRTRALAACRRR